MSAYNDYDALTAAVPTDQPLRVTAGDLRNTQGAKRLGIEVRSTIQDRLRDRGIGFFPPGEIPDRQEEVVYLYRLGSPLGSLISAITSPSDTGMRLLRDAIQPTADAEREQDHVVEALAAIEDAQSALRKTLGRGPAEQEEHAQAGS